MIHALACPAAAPRPTAAVELREPHCALRPATEIGSGRARLTPSLGPLGLPPFFGGDSKAACRRLASQLAAHSATMGRSACAKARRSVDRSVRWSKRRPAGTLRSRMLGLQATGRVAAPNAGAEMSVGTKRLPGTSATAGAVRLAACSTRSRRKVDESRSAKCGGWAAFRPFALVSSGEGRPRSSAGSLRLIAEERGSSLVAQALPPPP